MGEQSQDKGASMDATYAREPALASELSKERSEFMPESLTEQDLQLLRQNAHLVPAKEEKDIPLINPVPVDQGDRTWVKDLEAKLTSQMLGWTQVKREYRQKMETYKESYERKYGKKENNEDPVEKESIN